MKKKQHTSQYGSAARRRRSGGVPGATTKPGPGRPKGKPNKITQEFKELLAPLEKEGLKKLKTMMEASRDPDFILASLRFISDYRHGRPKQPIEASGPDGSPIQVDWLTFLQQAHSHLGDGKRR